ncbi:MAG: hypothetical protein JXR86_09070 [Spirochaetales bacterium]|nr:hypothetical protein [Spirochaetales bacterium]
MKNLLPVLLILLPFRLCAYIQPYTEYTDNHFYITTGEVDFNLDVRDVGAVLLDYNGYSRWAFLGMQGVDKESEGLIAYFTDVRYSASEDLFYVIFDLNLIWPFGKKGSEIAFKPIPQFDSAGKLVTLTLVPVLGNKMVHNANMLFLLRETATGSALRYESRIRLAPILDFFFSLRSYKKNFEWYVFKLAENLTFYLNNL